MVSSDGRRMKVPSCAASWVSIEGRAGVSTCGRRRFERRFESLGPLLGSRNAGACDAHDVGFDHDVIEPADEEQVLDIIPAQKHELPLAVEIIDIDDTKARLAGAGAILAVHHEAAAGQLAQDQAKQRHQHENDCEGDDVLGRPGRFDTELR